jgi:hypothetical protein
MDRVLGSERLTGTLLDRLTHHAHMISKQSPGITGCGSHHTRVSGPPISYPAATVVFMGDSIHQGSRVHHAIQIVQSSGMTAMPNSRVLRRSPGVLSGQARPPGLAANPQIMRYARILTPPVRPSWSAWRQRRGGQGARPIQPNRTHRHRDDGDHGKRFWWSCGSWPSKPRSWRAHSASQHSCLGRLSRN